MERVYLVGSGRLGNQLSDGYDCNMYLIDAGDGLILVDSGSGLGVEAVCRNIADHGFRLTDVKHILITHGHGDHSLGVHELQRRTGARIACSEFTAPILRNGDEEANNLRAAREKGRYPEHCKLIPCSVDVELKEGDRWQVGDLTFEIAHTPGHSFDMVCAYCPELDSLISSDMVFEGGRIVILKGNYDFSVQDLHASLKKLRKFEATHLFPGHLSPLIGNGKAAIDQAIDMFEQGREPESIVKIV